jgi:transposase
VNERVWSEKDLVRRAKRRLAVLQHAEEVSGSVAATCRYYGISRTVFYRWKHRYEDEGLDGLKDRSSAPMHCPTTTPSPAAWREIKVLALSERWDLLRRRQRHDGHRRRYSWQPWRGGAVQEQGKWKLALARWRAKRRSKRQQAAERQYSGRAARAARRRQIDDLEKYRDPGAGGGPI